MLLMLRFDIALFKFSPKSAVDGLVRYEFAVGVDSRHLQDGNIFALATETSGYAIVLAATADVGATQISGYVVYDDGDGGGVGGDIGGFVVD